MKCNTVKPGLYVSDVIVMHFDRKLLIVLKLTFFRANPIL